MPLTQVQIASKEAAAKRAEETRILWERIRRARQSDPDLNKTQLARRFGVCVQTVTTALRAA